MEAVLETQQVRIGAGGVTLDGNLEMPANPLGIVLFAHGGGSSRLSPRKLTVARALRTASIGTLLLDLLTPDEQSINNVNARLRSDITLLSARLLDATEWVRRQQPALEQRIGFYGSSTGAAAALTAAAKAPERIAAIVSLSGRVDLASDALPAVRAATLLIAGGRDTTVVWMTQRAYERLECQKQLTIVPGAGQLFEEPGTLEQVATLATLWYRTHFTSH